MTFINASPHEVEATDSRVLCDRIHKRVVSSIQNALRIVQDEVQAWAPGDKGQGARAPSRYF